MALVYYEGHSIREAGRLLGWGKSNADYHHTEAMKRLQALVGPRELLSPAIVGLVAQATTVADRARLVGGLANRVSAAVQDLADFVSRVIGSATRGATEAARRAAPFADSGTAAISGGAGRAIAQCGTLVTAAVCAAILVSPIEESIESLAPARRPTTEKEDHRSRKDRSHAPTESRSTQDRLEAAPTQRSDENHTQQRLKRRGQRANAQRTPKGTHSNGKAKQNTTIEAPEENAPGSEPENPTSETESAAPPPATGEQTRQEFGL